MFKNSNIGLLIQRLTIGILMLFHGIYKLKGLSYVKGLLVSSHLPSFLAYGVYITEIIAPILIIVGYRTRFASLILSLGALVAMFLKHSTSLFTLNNNGLWNAELIGLYFFGGIVLVFMGGGQLSISSKNKWD